MLENSDEPLNKALKTEEIIASGHAKINHNINAKQ
jgi:hypothetical protein